MKKINSQYSNIRNQNKNEILEDYVEAIQEISEIKGDVKNADLSIHFGVSQATINKNLKRLISSKLATSEPYRSIFLTDKGKKLALLALFFKRLSCNNFWLLLESLESTNLSSTKVT